MNGTAQNASETSGQNSGALTLLFDAIVLLVKWRVFIIVLTSVCIVAGVVLALCLPKVYTASTKLMPHQVSKNAFLAQQLGSLAGLAEDTVNLQNPNDVYLSMLKTRVIEDNLIKRFGLQKLYGFRYLEQTREHLESLTDAESGKNDVIDITVKDHDPERAAQLANAYVEELQKMLRDLESTEASQKKSSYRRQLDDAESDLEAAQIAFKAVQQKTGVLQLEAEERVMVESIAKAKADLAEKEIELQGLKLTETPNHPDVIRLEQQVEGLRSEVASLEQKGSSNQGTTESSNGLASAGVEYSRRFQDVKFQEALVEVLFKEFESARMAEANESVTIRVLDPAVPPKLRTSPRRLYIVVVFFALGLFLSVSFVFLFEAGRTLVAKPEIKARLNLAKQYMGKSKSV